MSSDPNEFVTLYRTTAPHPANNPTGHWRQVIDRHSVRVSADQDDPLRAVVQATRTLDRLPWRGAKAVATQATAWPRSGIGTTALPADVEVAAILIAAHLVAYPGVQLAEPATVSEEEVGDKRVRYFHHLADVVERVVGPELAVEVRPYLAPWLALGPKAPFAAAD